MKRISDIIDIIELVEIDKFNWVFPINQTNTKGVKINARIRKVGKEYEITLRPKIKATIKNLQTNHELKNLQISESIFNSISRDILASTTQIY